MTKRKKYTKEFKLDAISLVRDQSLNIAEASRNLEINLQLLGRWIKEDESEEGQAFRGNGKLTPDQEEIRKLKAQVKRLERLDLVKGIAQFSDNTYGERRIQAVLNTLSFPSIGGKLQN